MSPVTRRNGFCRLPPLGVENIFAAHTRLGPQKNLSPKSIVCCVFGFCDPLPSTVTKFECLPCCVLGRDFCIRGPWPTRAAELSVARMCFVLRFFLLGPIVQLGRRKILFWASESHLCFVYSNLICIWGLCFCNVAPAFAYKYVTCFRCIL